MFTAKRSAFKKAEWLWALIAWLQRTSGGSRETELKELAVTPWNLPSPSVVVTAVTPVTKAPSTRRNSRLSNGPMSGICTLHRVQDLHVHAAAASAGWTAGMTSAAKLRTDATASACAIVPNMKLPMT